MQQDNKVVYVYANELDKLLNIAQELLLGNKESRKNGQLILQNIVDNEQSNGLFNNIFLVQQVFLLLGKYYCEKDEYNIDLAINYCDKYMLYGGLVGSVFDIAYKYHIDTTKQNCSLASHLYKLCIKYGCVSAQNNLGCVLFNGHGCDKDVNEAIKLYISSGNKEAMNNLYGIANDFKKQNDFIMAKKLLEECCKCGHKEAHTSLGLMYLFGQINDQLNTNKTNIELAIDHYMCSGNDTAITNLCSLGEAYEKGNTMYLLEEMKYSVKIDKNLEKALSIYELILDKSDFAKNRVAWMLINNVNQTNIDLFAQNVSRAVNLYKEIRDEKGIIIKEDICEFFEKCVSFGNVFAMYKLAKYYIDNKIQNQSNKCVKLLERCISSGELDQHSAWNCEIMLSDIYTQRMTHTHGYTLLDYKLNFLGTRSLPKSYNWTMLLDLFCKENQIINDTLNVFLPKDIHSIINQYIIDAKVNKLMYQNIENYMALHNSTVSNNSHTQISFPTYVYKSHTNFAMETINSYLWFPNFGAKTTFINYRSLDKPLRITQHIVYHPIVNYPIINHKKILKDKNEIIYKNKNKNIHSLLHKKAVYKHNNHKIQNKQFVRKGNARH